MTIRAVLFDFGGVILRTEDHTPRERLAASLGLTPEALYRLVFNNQTARLAAIGKITAAEHMDAVRKELGVSPEEFPAILDAFWEGDLVDETLVAYIRGLRSNWKTALLSNAWDDLRKVIGNHWKIVDAFDELIISAEVGIAKPDPRIFQFAIECLGILPAQGVFIDDFIENVQAARAYGLAAIHFRNVGQMQSELAEILEGV
jgi:epoxide hydrolase-like predicted phosphatase